MALLSFAELYNLADAARERVPVVAAGGADVTVLEALCRAAVRGWVTPFVTGDRAEIELLAAREGLDLSPIQILPGEDPAATAVAEVKAGRAALLMKGQIATPLLMKAVLSRETGLRTECVIGQVVLMELRRDDRRFLLTDTGIAIQPTLEQKDDLLRSLIAVGESLQQRGERREPLRVAIMAASEKVTEAMPDTLEAAQLQQRCEEGRYGSCLVEGPLSFDLAYAAEAGERKRLEGRVMGVADAMLFPTLQAANLTVKAIMYTADCQFGGLLVGTSAPVVFMSRADTTATRLNSLALTLQVLRSRT